MQFPKLKIGISECLLGAKVRFDGGHKLDKYIVNYLSPYCEFVAICPEVAIGMGVPRPPIRLVGDPNKPQVVGVKDATLNVTKPLTAYSKQCVKELNDISGYILKSRSPTCGMQRVKVYGEKNSAPSTEGVGVFAKALMDAHPLLPVEEEGRLNDPILRENFIERIFAFRRWQDLLSERLTMGRLVEFHTQHKLTLMAHNLAGYKRLGHIIANAEKLTPKAVALAYGEEFMKVMQMRCSNKRHTNVLEHILGYFKDNLNHGDKEELLAAIHRYRVGQLPLIVPITLVQHYLRKFPKPYLQNQTYLHPHPDELMLRNHI